MMRTDVRIEGIDRVSKRLNELAEAYPNATMAAINAEAENIFMDSQDRVPIDTGNLKSSGYVRRVLDVKGMEVGYGGQQAPYALVVHELHPFGKKYLETPFKDALSGMRRRIVDHIKRTVRI